MDRLPTAAQWKSNGKPLKRSRSGKLCDVVVIVLLFMISTFQVVEIEPNQQFIPGDDSSNNFNFAYPNVTETISTGQLLALCLCPWVILLCISTLWLRLTDAHFSWTEWLSQCSVMLRMALFCFNGTIFTTFSVKLFCGSPRPYFLAADDDVKLGARDSFPSGHSSMSMASLFLLSMMMYESWAYVQRMYYAQTYSSDDVLGMSTANPNAFYLCQLWWWLRELPMVGMLLVIAPAMLAVWCGCTRIVDYKHFAVDVVAGFVIGAAWAVIAFKTFWCETYVSFEYRLKVELDALVNDEQARRSEMKEVDFASDAQQPAI